MMSAIDSGVGNSSKYGCSNALAAVIRISGLYLNIACANVGGSEMQAAGDLTHAVVRNEPSSA